MVVDRKKLGEQSFKKGFWAEFKAICYLMIHGYFPLKWRYKNRYGEIDLIFRKNRVLIFVEVKARPSLQMGYDSIAYVQKQRIQRSAEHFIKTNRKYKKFGQRFDSVIIRPKELPIHLVGLW